MEARLPLLRRSDQPHQQRPAVAAAAAAAAASMEAESKGESAPKKEKKRARFAVGLKDEKPDAKDELGSGDAPDPVEKPKVGEDQEKE